METTTGKPIPGITVNLRLGDYPGRNTVQYTTDSNGTAYFYLAPPLLNGVSVDAFSVRYHATQSDAEIKYLPQQVTIPVRRLSLIQSLHYIFAGD